MHDVSHPLYLPLRLIHVLGSMVFLGGLVFMLHAKLGADRAGSASVAARTHERLRQADGQLIGTSAFFIFAGGYSMVRFLGGRIANHMFVLTGLILLTVALALWYFGTRNIGDRLIELARSAEKTNQPLGQDYAKASGAWVLTTAAAILTVVVTVIVMVFKLPSA